MNMTPITEINKTNILQILEAFDSNNIVNRNIKEIEVESISMGKYCFVGELGFISPNSNIPVKLKISDKIIYNNPSLILSLNELILKYTAVNYFSEKEIRNLMTKFIICRGGVSEEVLYHHNMFEEQFKDFTAEYNPNHDNNINVSTLKNYGIRTRILLGETNFSELEQLRIINMFKRIDLDFNFQIMVTKNTNQTNEVQNLIHTKFSSNIQNIIDNHLDELSKTFLFMINALDDDNNLQKAAAFNKLFLLSEDKILMFFNHFVNCRNYDLAFVSKFKEPLQEKLFEKQDEFSKNILTILINNFYFIRYMNNNNINKLKTLFPVNLSDSESLLLPMLEEGIYNPEELSTKQINILINSKLITDGQLKIYLKKYMTANEEDFIKILNSDECSPKFLEKPIAKLSMGNSFKESLRISYENLKVKKYISPIIDWCQLPLNFKLKDKPNEVENIIKILNNSTNSPLTPINIQNLFKMENARNIEIKNLYIELFSLSKKVFKDFIYSIKDDYFVGESFNKFNLTKQMKDFFENDILEHENFNNMMRLLAFSEMLVDKDCLWVNKKIQSVLAHKFKTAINELIYITKFPDEELDENNKEKTTVQAAKKLSLYSCGLSYFMQNKTFEDIDPVIKTEVYDVIMNAGVDIINSRKNNSLNVKRDLLDLAEECLSSSEQKYIKFLRYDNKVLANRQKEEIDKKTLPHQIIEKQSSQQELMI